MKLTLLYSITLLSVCFLACQNLFATATVRFRDGEIVSAELSQRKLLVSNRSKYEPKSRFSDATWAQVAVKLDKGRTLSIYDFTLIGPSAKTYKCIALAEGDAPYDANKWKIENASPDKLYKLLYKVQLPGFNQYPDYTLVFNLFKTKIPNVTIEFRKMGAKSFTLLSNIPVEGLVGVTQPNLIRALVEARNAKARREKQELKKQKALKEKREKAKKQATTKATIKKDDKPQGPPEDIFAD